MHLPQTIDQFSHKHFACVSVDGKSRKNIVDWASQYFGLCPEYLDALTKAWCEVTGRKLPKLTPRHMLGYSQPTQTQHAIWERALELMGYVRDGNQWVLNRALAAIESGCIAEERERMDWDDYKATHHD